MNLPSQTSDIFSRLSKGEFICSNSKQKNIQNLYDIIQEEETEKALKEYFIKIDFVLEKGNGYYYFSKREEEKQNIERKIMQFERYIDILNYFSLFENKPVYRGNVFSITHLLHETENNAKLDVALKSIKFVENTLNLRDKIKQIMDLLTDYNFLECFDKIDDRYLVLDSFDYLIKIVELITPFENE